MRFRLQLERRTRQKQKALGSSRNRIHEQIFLTRKVVFADQMMSFIDNRQIPFRAQKILRHSRLAHHEFNRANHIVCLIERIRIVAFMHTAFKEAANIAFIHQGEYMVKATVHFCHPLVLQRFRHKDECSRNAARAAQGMPDHAGFDRLT